METRKLNKNVHLYEYNNIYFKYIMVYTFLQRYYAYRLYVIKYKP